MAKQTLHGGTNVSLIESVKNEVSIVLETFGCWRCQGHGMLGMDHFIQGVDSACSD